jgi:hypothetical protein
VISYNSLQGKDASMGLASGTKPLPFGHSAEAAIDIEGLAVCLIYACILTMAVH